MAASLLSLKFSRQGNDLVAGGFPVFAIAEGVLMSGTAARPARSVPAFAAGTALWATALFLVSIPRGFARDALHRRHRRNPVHDHLAPDLLG